MNVSLVVVLAAALAAGALVWCLVSWLTRPPAPEFWAPILAYRAWQVDQRGELRSLGTWLGLAGDCWGAGTHVARCRCRLKEGQRPHVVPDRRGHCGNYALSSLALTRRAVRHTLRFRQLSLGLLVVVVPVMAAWAGVKEQLPGLVAGGIGIGAAILLVELHRRSRQRIVYGLVMAWGDQVALDVVRPGLLLRSPLVAGGGRLRWPLELVSGVQVRSPLMRPLALVWSPAAVAVGRRLGIPVLREDELVDWALQHSEAELLDPSLLGAGR